MRKSGVERCYFPKRHILALLGFIGMFSMFAMRISVSVTIVAMVNSTAKGDFSNFTNAEEVCTNPKLTTEVTELEKFTGPQYNWDIEKQGLILGSFYYGYILTQVPAGFLAERIGAKWLFGGMTFPSINLLISKWSPKMERSRISTFVFTGIPIGCVLSMPIAGLLSDIELLGGWPSVFYIFGTFSCVWFVFWAVLAYETPAQHLTIALKEFQYIQGNNDEQPLARSKTPWKAIFSSLPMWSIFVAQAANNFGYLLLMAELPTYLSTVLHFNLKENGLLSAIPFLVETIFALIASDIADRLRQSNTLNITNIRKIFSTIGLIGPALCLLGITASECRPYLIIFFLTLGMALEGFTYSGFNVTHIDMCPNFAGTALAITNSFSCITGFIAPAIVGALLKTGATISNWNNVFYITAVIFTFGAIFFAAFASAELQPWAIEKVDVQPCTDGKEDANVVKNVNK